MSITHSCDTEKVVIFVVWDREVTWDEWRGQFPRVLTDLDWFAISRLVANVHTLSNRSAMGSTKIEEAAAIFGSNLNAVVRTRVAVIARDEFGKVKYFGDLIARFGARRVVFNSLDTGCVFLGIDLRETRKRLQELRAMLRAVHNMV